MEQKETPHWIRSSSNIVLVRARPLRREFWVDIRRDEMLLVLGSRAISIGRMKSNVLLLRFEKDPPKGIQLLVNKTGIARRDYIKCSNESPDFKVTYPRLTITLRNNNLSVRPSDLRPPLEV